MFPMFIKFFSILQTSWMILKEVDPVEANQYTKPFYVSFDPSVDDDAVAILLFFCKIKDTSKICLPPSPPAPFRSICLHPNQRCSPVHFPAYFIFLILSLFFLHPPPPCLCGLQK
jgi:hypothetical protein